MIERQNVESIDILRGLASLSVAIYHVTCGNTNFMSGNIFKSIASWGWLGVEVFFVISGFIIPYSLWKSNFNLSEHWYKFISKRVIRIDPPYLISIILTLVLWFFSSWIPGFKGNPPEINWGQIAAHVGYVVDFIGSAWIQPVYWTLAIEFQYYLLVMLFVGVLISNDDWKRRIVLSLIILSPFLVAEKYIVFHWFALFSLGISAFLYSSQKMSFPEFIIFIVLGLTVCSLEMGIPETIAGTFSVFFILNIKQKFLEPFHFLGKISYSLYLIHIPIGGRIINLFVRFADDVYLQLLGVFCALICSLLFGWLFYEYVEKPSKRLSSKLAY